MWWWRWSVAIISAPKQVRYLFIGIKPSHGVLSTCFPAPYPAIRPHRRAADPPRSARISRYFAATEQRSHTIVGFPNHAMLKSPRHSPFMEKVLIDVPSDEALHRPMLANSMNPL